MINIVHMMKFSRLFLSFIILIILMNSCQQPVSEPVDYLNETREELDKRMMWWEEARFGMFIHWGLYAVPAGEWNGETNHAEWIRTTAQIPKDTYGQFINEFNPKLYDPEKWVKIAKQAGMKYIVITSKHHDGFCLFDSEYTDFDISSTPFQKDLLKKLADACRKEDMKICWYHSIMDWHHPDYLPRREWEKDTLFNGVEFDRYVTYMKNQLKELVENYGDIGVLWFDGEWEGTWTNEKGKDLYNYVRNLQPDIIINNRVDKGRSGMAGMTREGEYAGDFGTPEQEIPATGLPGKYWETCMTMNNHWGYNKNDDNWKSSTDLIQKLTDIASKGGNFLLNVGPKANGEFPDESIERLQTIGKWMELNGESIYGTKASPFKFLDFGRSTQKSLGESTRLYLHVFDWPEDHMLRIHGLFNHPHNAYLLADPEKTNLEVFRQEDAIFIKVPADCPDEMNSVVVLDIEGKPDVNDPPLIKAEQTIFIDKLAVEITSKRDNIEIRYTTNGDIPDMDSEKVLGILNISKTCVVTARCFRDGKPVSGSSSIFLEKVLPLPPMTITGLQPGIKARYYEGEWDKLPSFDQLKPINEFITNTINLEGKVRDEYFGFVFEGFIKISHDGIYTFYTDSDDGSQLLINDQLIVDNDGLHGMEIKKGAVPLSKGVHQIRVPYFEKSGGDDLKVYYSGPGFEKKIIPAEILFSK